MTAALQPPISVSAFREWLAQAEPCMSLEYHRGFLSRDRSPVSDLDEGQRRIVAAIADAAMRAAEDGRVHLVQRRNGPFDFSYLAIKASATSRPAVVQGMIPSVQFRHRGLDHPAILRRAA